jgi:hypothetical protein
LQSRHPPPPSSEVECTTQFQSPSPHNSNAADRLRAAGTELEFVCHRLSQSLCCVRVALKQTMGMELTNPTFVKWLKSNFDHPVTGSAWDEVNTGWRRRPPSVSIECITCAFENSAQVFILFSDAQLNQGLLCLIDVGGEIHALFDDAMPLPARLRCIRSIFTLFEQCFAARCSSNLLQDDKKASALNSVCSMWWDIFPTWGRPESPNPAHNKLDEECLNVMKRTLYLNSDACRESALHGLGHWHLTYSNKVTSVIDEFLESRPKISRKLRDYALAVREGAVL